jgi:hypothetical protein
MNLESEKTTAAWENKMRIDWFISGIVLYDPGLVKIVFSRPHISIDGRSPLE